MLDLLICWSLDILLTDLRKCGLVEVGKYVARLRYLRKADIGEIVLS